MNRCLWRPMKLATLPFEEEFSSFVEDTVTLSRDEYEELTRQASQGNYWKEQANTLENQHKHACKDKDFLLNQVVKLIGQINVLETKTGSSQDHCWQKEKLRETIKTLRAEIEEKKGVIRSLKQQLFDRKSEKGVCKSESQPNTSEALKKKPRGQQKGTRGHGRTKHTNLAVKQEFIPIKETCCLECGEAYSSLPSDKSNIFEVEVKGYTRVIERQKLVRNCKCPGPKIIIAPRAAKVLPKNPYGVSVWEYFLRHKFLQAQPINRILKSLEYLGVKISSGTVAGGLKKIAPLFEPLHNAFYNKQMTESHFNSDESPWKVFEQIKDKIGNRFYLWVTRSKSVVFFLIDPTRSAKAPLKHFSKLCLDNVIVVCDRYSSYFKLARLNPFITLAFCWVHVRRDFLKIANSYPDLADWGLEWVNSIGKFYQLNKERLLAWNPELPLLQQSSLFKEKQEALTAALHQMKVRCDTLFEADKQAKKEKIGEQLHPSQHKALKSMRRCWQGLTVFLEHPETPMDNNSAERSIRNPVIGRKNYYGSGSLWSAKLAAMMFTIFQTILLWKINPQTYLTLYLQACAENNGKAPKNIDEFLPWNMSTARLEQLQKPLSTNSS